VISTPAPNPIKRVGILFSGGPAPAANAVISAAASSLRRSGREVVAIKHGYGALMQFDRATRPLVPGEDYDEILDRELRGLRHQRGVLVGTGRANPGKSIKRPKDLDDPEKTAPLQRVVDGLREIGIDALVSIGGDDTLRTANLLHSSRGDTCPRAPRACASSTCPRPSTTTTRASTSPSGSSPRST